MAAGREDDPGDGPPRVRGLHTLCWCGLALMAVGGCWQWRRRTEDPPVRRLRPQRLGGSRAHMVQAQTRRPRLRPPSAPAAGRHDASLRSVGVAAVPRMLGPPSSHEEAWLLHTGGRHRNDHTSDVLLWTATDGSGESWTPYSLSAAHNAGTPDPSLRYDANVNSTTFSPRETNRLLLKFKKLVFLSVSSAP